MFAKRQGEGSEEHTRVRMPLRLKVALQEISSQEDFPYPHRERRPICQVHAGLKKPSDVGRKRQRAQTLGLRVFISSVQRNILVSQ
jgi:hypothetical protein